MQVKETENCRNGRFAAYQSPDFRRRERRTEAAGLWVGKPRGASGRLRLCMEGLHWPGGGEACRAGSAAGYRGEMHKKFIDWEENFCRMVDTGLAA